MRDLESIKAANANTRGRGYVAKKSTRDKRAKTREGTDRWPPDPENMNENRAQWGGAALEHFMTRTGADIEDALADLLCDLRHWCDRNNTSFADEDKRGLAHYKVETLTPDQYAAWWRRGRLPRE